MKKSIYFETESGTPYYHCTVTQFSFIPEVRVYLKNKYLLKNLDRGIFLQAGFELFHYMIWKSSNSKGSGFSLYPDNLNGYFERNIPIGVGIKYPLKNNKGLELNISTNLSEVINQGNNQTFTVGVKYFWMRK